MDLSLFLRIRVSFKGEYAKTKEKVDLLQTYAEKCPTSQEGFLARSSSVAISGVLFSSSGKYRIFSVDPFPVRENGRSSGETAMSEHPFESQEDVLRALVLRVAAIPGDPSASDQQLLVGQFPENLPVSFPLPEQSQLLGSLLRNAAHTEVILNTLLSPAQIIDFYRDYFLAIGWGESEDILGLQLLGIIPPSNEIAVLNW